MNHHGSNAATVDKPVWATGLLALLLISVCGANGRSTPINLFPRLQAGQVLAYQVSYHSDKHVRTKSSVIAATPDDSAKMDVNALLRLEVLDVRAQGQRANIRARAKFAVLDSTLGFRVPQVEPPAPQAQRQSREAKFIEFTILPNGRLDQITGLEALFPEQQQAWQEWASRFLLASTLPAPGARITQKWNSQEAERSSSPLAGLRWLRESTYVRDEPCHSVQLTLQGGATSSDADLETCAVILTTAILKQDSHARNSTPDDFKLHELRTVGSARGSNRIITYISLKTGLLIRATEEATQEMNVTVAKADGSNRVHYDVDARSHSEVLRVSDTPLSNP